MHTMVHYVLTVDDGCPNYSASLDFAFLDLFVIPRDSNKLFFMLEQRYGNWFVTSNKPFFNHSS
jgi:hypothetical protein